MGRSRWGGITTQGKDLRELASAIEEAVRCHFAGRTAPREVALHFCRQIQFCS